VGQELQLCALVGCRGDEDGGLPALALVTPWTVGDCVWALSIEQPEHLRGVGVQGHGTRQ